MTGEHSQFPITRLASKYLEMTTDGRILSNRQSIEIIRTRVFNLLDRIDKNEAPERLNNLRELWEKHKVFQIAGMHIERQKVDADIDAEFEAAYHDYMAWTQMFEALDLDRKMVESEVKIAKDLKAMLTAEDAYEFGAKLLASIIEAANSLILDDSTRSRFLKRIQYEFAKLVGDRIVGDESAEEDNGGSGGSSSKIIDSVTSTVD